MTHILFICTANQFRSPIAAAYLNRKLASSNKLQKPQVSSAGTWTPEGLPAHPKAIEVGVKFGLDLKHHRTLEVNAELLEAANQIIVMQYSHKEAIEAEFPFTQGKVFLLGQLARITEVEIQDPAIENFQNSEEIARIICLCIDRCYLDLPGINEE
jgi:protein-tyrosine-phosphatase